MVEIKHLGVGSGFNDFINPENFFAKPTNAYFVMGDTLYFIDCGEGILNTLKTEGIELTDYKRIVIFLTHLHPDHAGGLASILGICYFRYHIPVYIWRDDTQIDFLFWYDLQDMLATQLDAGFDFYNEIWTDDLPFKVKSYDADHGTMLAKSLLFEFAPDDIVYYSGDTTGDSTIECLQEVTPTRMYHEVSLAEGGVHMGFEKLREILEVYNYPKDHVWAMHFSKVETCRKVLEEGYNIPELPGYVLENPIYLAEAVEILG